MSVLSNCNIITNVYDDPNHDADSKRTRKHNKRGGQPKTETDEEQFRITLVSNLAVYRLEETTLGIRQLQGHVQSAATGTPHTFFHNDNR